MNTIKRKETDKQSNQPIIKQTLETLQPITKLNTEIKYIYSLISTQELVHVRKVDIKAHSRCQSLW